MAGIYIHIPFCKQACHYCDFHFSTSMKTKDKILSAISREIEIQRDYLQKEPLSSIYFGGGTPSILDGVELKSILNKIKEIHTLEDDLEITLECNPDDLDLEKLKSLFEIGINRLSIGIQSFRDKDLSFMNRAHNSKEALEVVGLAKSVGFENMTIDLIYGIPGLNNDHWKENLQKAIELDVPHISSYCLTIENGTAFSHFAKKGELIPVTDEVASDQYLMMVDMLSEAGYNHYEVSNFAKEGAISKHNSSYWKSKKYLGIGPSAHSFNGVSRQWNVANNMKYSIAIEKGEPFFEKEALDQKTRYNEYLLTGLRTSWGIDVTYILNEFDIDFLQLNNDYLQDLTINKDAQLNNNIFKLTEKGFLRADGITSDLFLLDLE